MGVDTLGEFAHPKLQQRSDTTNMEPASDTYSTAKRHSRFLAVQCGLEGICISNCQYPSHDRCLVGTTGSPPQSPNYMLTRRENIQLFVGK